MAICYDNADVTRKCNSGLSQLSKAAHDLECQWLKCRTIICVVFSMVLQNQYDYE